MSTVIIPIGSTYRLSNNSTIKLADSAAILSSIADSYRSADRSTIYSTIKCAIRVSNCSTVFISIGITNTSAVISAIATSIDVS